MSTDVPKPACDAERERLREVAKYYCIVDRPSSDNGVHILQGSQRPDDEKRPSQDTALTGLARLGVLQFGCNRAFVSIIDEANQHVIAEATTSASLRNAGTGRTADRLYLGVRSLDLKWGVVPQTTGFFTRQIAPVRSTNLIANHSRYIVRDLSKEEPYKSRPYVADWPLMRFYVAVPIRGPGGHVLGSYCLVDNKPRSGFGNSKIESMQEIADAIGQHLEIARLSRCHRRTETLVKSLTTFVKEHDDFDSTDSYEATPTQAGSHAPDSVDDENDHSRKDVGFADETHQTAAEDDEVCLGQCSPSEVTGEASSLFSKVLGSEQTEASIPFQGERPSSAWSLGMSRRGSVPHNAPTITNTPVNDAQQSATQVANKISKIFRRASVLLRDSMDLDGVLFVDASRCNAGVVLSNDTGTWEPLPSTLSPDILTEASPSPLEMPGVGSLSRASEVPCTILGRALRRNVGSTEPYRHFNISEKVLDELMASFPQGQIFNISDLPQEWPFPTYSDPATELCRQLARCFPGAESVLFSPIWDWSKSRWLAGTLVWTRDTIRALGAEELHYFKAFGDSIISEVARVDWSTTQRSKSAFMSSVSHELRSPLHGILASAELLGSNSLPPEERRLVDMVESCGLTLLDTLNHLLDFSGINNLSALEESNRGSSEAGMASLETEFDLGDLVEEVVEVQYTGQNLPKAALHLRQVLSLSEGDSDTESSELSVIVRVEPSPTWRIQSAPGAWRRIVMNLLGNSLKWTKAGFVEVSLSKVRRKRDPMHVFAVLSVTDTGAGIAPDFLRHNVFSPFTQENSLSEGLGLGLSTVRQLVASLDGHLNVRSEVDVGTQVDIYVPVEILSPPSDSTIVPTIHSEIPERTPLNVSLIGFNNYPGPKETPTGILPAEAKRKLAIRSCLTGIITGQAGWSMSSPEAFDDLDGDVAIVEEATLEHALKAGHPLLENTHHNGLKKMFIILNSKTPTYLPIESSRIVRVSQPFGSRKFLDAIRKVDEILQGQRSNSSVSTPSTECISDYLRPELVASPAPPPPQPEKQEVAAPEKPEVEPTKPSNSGKLPASEGYHLLIVDDNDINLKILATFAGKIGCTFDTASNGLVALNTYKESTRKYDLVLMDISMPVMDGIVATNEIRQYEQEKGLERSQIFAVTGVASDEMQRRAKAAGIDEYLVKPVSLAALKKVIAALP